MRIGISLPVRELQDDVAALIDFAQAAEELGLTHLRVPDQVIRPDSGQDAIAIHLTTKSLLDDFIETLSAGQRPYQDHSRARHPALLNSSRRW